MDVAELTKFMGQLKASSTIPLQVNQAFLDRLGITSLARVVVSTKTLASENQAVAEGGVANYSVLKPPDAWLQVIVSGTTYYIPVFDS